MADGEVRAPNLTEETASTLNGDEELVMFDTAEGKRAALSVIADYIVQHGEIGGNDISTIISEVESKIGTLTNLDTTAKTDLVAAINELVSNVSDIDSSIAPAYSSSSTYAVGDLVIHDNKLYTCTTAITTAENWTAGHWAAVTISSELSDLKEDLDAISVSYDSTNKKIVITY